MQVAFYFAGEITQVLDAIPWVRCASGNVFIMLTDCLFVVEKWQELGGTENELP